MLIFINLDNNFLIQMQQRLHNTYFHAICIWRLVHGHKISNVKPQLYMCIHGYFFRNFNLYRISFRINLELFCFFLLPFSAFFAVHGLKKICFFFVAKATDLRSILFSSRHYDDERAHTHHVHA